MQTSVVQVIIYFCIKVKTDEQHSQDQRGLKEQYLSIQYFHENALHFILLYYIIYPLLQI